MGFNARLTNQRIQEHLLHATTYCAKGDYVQAGEKVYGALIGIINKRSNQEVRGRDNKIRKFLNLIGDLRFRDPSQVPFLSQYFNEDVAMWWGIFGLHEFFYGSAYQYTNRYLSGVISYFIQLLQML